MVDWPPCCHTKCHRRRPTSLENACKLWSWEVLAGVFVFRRELVKFLCLFGHYPKYPEHSWTYSLLHSVPILVCRFMPYQKMMVYDPWPNLLWKVGLKFWITAPYLSLFAGYTSMFDCHTRYPHMYTYVTYVSISQSGWFYFPFRFYLQDWCFSYPILVCEESQFLLVISWLYHCCRTWYTQLSQLIPALFGHVSPIAMGH